ncbi:MAG: polysaccharide deacetylase, partial [Clostridia bacterium]|nr:polysaccharide deacetylase [Clostridia bacterium]
MDRNIRTAAIVLLISVMALVGFLLLHKNGPEQIAKGEPTPSAAATESQSPANSPAESPSTSPSAEPATETPAPQKNLVIRTDYASFKPNEVGEIPIIMFHRFIEAYEPNTEKDYTTTFGEFETLLQTLYDQGYRLISMQDFIDCNISVPAGTKPMVFTFDDGTPGEFNLIKENGELKVNPKSAVGIMIEFNKKHPDFGLKGMFYVYLDSGNSIFQGEGTLKERFEALESLGLELGNHTYGHVDFTKISTKEKIEEVLGMNQAKAEEILPGLRFYSLSCLL